MPKFCTNCGSPLADGARFCNKCGAQITPTQPQSAPPPPPQYQAPPSYQQAAGYQQAPGYQQPPYPVARTNTGLQPNIAGLLCYVPWIGLIAGIIFLVVEPYNKDRFVRFHAFQTIFLSVAWLILWVAASTFWAVLPWGLHFIITLLFLALRLGGFLLWIFLMYKAYNNEMFKLPVIGDFAMQQAG